MRRLLKRLRRDEHGNAIIEFAFVLPVFATMLIGVFDVAHTLYTSSMLQGAMQKAGRDFTLEDSRGRKDPMENYVRRQIKKIAPSADVKFTRKAYFDFEDVGQAEEFDDDNLDGICNDNEPFEDVNGNGQWDSDRGEDESFGGARDAVLFTAKVTYKRLFPMAGLVGLSENVELAASTVLRNQPFDTQDRTVETGNCT